MKIPHSILLLFLLAACGRQEPVDVVPSAEELANAANAAAVAAAANLTEEEALATENRNYVNSARGFSITLPEGWTRDAKASTADGVVFEDAGAGADIRVFWSNKAGDSDLAHIVAGMNVGSEAVDGDFVTDNEYRGTANNGKGNSVAIRLIRKPDGSLVTATFAFPEMLNEQYLAIGQKALDSLRVFDAAGAIPAEGANATGNATGG
ncbi:hypothetical protein BH10PSE12_BH10PSE12_06900 [soil metagenome]